MTKAEIMKHKTREAQAAKDARRTPEGARAYYPVLLGEIESMAVCGESALTIDVSANACITTLKQMLEADGFTLGRTWAWDLRVEW